MAQEVEDAHKGCSISRFAFFAKVFAHLVVRQKVQKGWCASERVTVLPVLPFANRVLFCSEHDPHKNFLGKQDRMHGRTQPDPHKGGHYISIERSPTTCSDPPCGGQVHVSQ